MQIVKETATNKVLYLFDDKALVRITERGMRSPVLASDITPYTHTIEKDVTAPETFLGGLMTYVDGAWAIPDQAVFDQTLAARAEQEAEQERLANRVMSVSMRQARLALLQIGKLADVETVIDSLPEPDKSAAKIEWEYAQTVDRNWPWVNQLTTAMGMTEEDVDGLFVVAAAL